MVDRDNGTSVATSMFTERRVAALLRQRVYRVTPQRQAVLRAIAASRGRLTPSVIHQRACQEHPGLGLVTVYRLLEVLVDLGLICEVHAGGGCGSYLMRKPAEHHHHLVCADCGAVVDFSHCDLDGLERRLSWETGFQVQGHILEFSGRCRDCQRMVTEVGGQRGV
jgi:Fur family ferric uptake transcriptional regulator